MIKQIDPAYITSNTNKKKAILIGIEYIGTSSELPGCQTEVKNVFNLLRSMKDEQRKLSHNFMTKKRFSKKIYENRCKE